MPAIVAVGLEPVAELIDTAFLGQFKDEWVAAVAATNAFLASFIWIFNFLSYSVTAQIAQSFGKSKAKHLGTLIKASTGMAAGLGLTVLIVLGFGQDFFLRDVLGVSPKLLPHAQSYWQIRVLGFPFSLLALSLIGILRGLGEIQKTVYIAVCITAVNSIGTYLGLYHFNSGIEGAAWATMASFLAGDILAIIFIMRHPSKLEWNWRDKLALSDLIHFGREGVQLFARSACLNMAFFTLSLTVTRLGTSSLAAHQIALQLWLCASFFTDGLAVTANALGAKLLGAGKMALHRLMCRRLLLLGVALGCLLASGYSLLSEEIILFFTKSPELTMELNKIWPLLAGMQIINSPLYVFDGIYFGARKYEFLRRRVFEGLLLCFAPAITYGFFISGTLHSLWIAMALFAAYRMISAGIGFFTGKALYH